MKKLVFILICILSVTVYAQERNFGGAIWSVENSDLSPTQMYSGQSYYNKIDVKGACPAGWHVATHDDWDKLRHQTGGFSSNVGANLSDRSVFGETLCGRLRNINNNWELRYGGQKGCYWVDMGNYYSTVTYSPTSFTLTQNEYSGTDLMQVRCVKNLGQTKEASVIIPEPDFVTVNGIQWSTEDADNNGSIYFDLNSALSDPCPTGWQVPTMSDYYSLLGGVSNYFEYMDGNETVREFVIDIDFLEDSLKFDYKGYIESTGADSVAWQNWYSAYFINEADYKQYYAMFLFRLNASNKSRFYLNEVTTSQLMYNKFPIRCIKRVNPQTDGRLLVEGYNYVKFETFTGTLSELFGTNIDKVYFIKTDDDKPLKYYIKGYTLPQAITIENIEPGRLYMIRVNSNFKISAQ